MSATIEYRAIDGQLLGAGLRAGFGVHGDYTPDISYCEDQDVPVELVRQLVAHIQEGFEPCDHSVGICSCSELTTLTDLELWLDGLRRCRLCGGEGLTIDQRDPDLDAFCRCHGVVGELAPGFVFQAGIVPLDWEIDAPEDDET